MIPDAHKKLMRWARWEKLPVGHCGPMAGGTTITAKLMEGRGQFLPGAPRGSGPMKVDPDPEALGVEKYLRTLRKRQVEIVKMVYLVVGYTMDEKADMLKMSRPSMYSHLHKIHFGLMTFDEEQYDARAKESRARRLRKESRAKRGED